MRACPFDLDGVLTDTAGVHHGDGVRSFLAGRNITLPESSPDDGPGGETVHGPDQRKNQLFLERLRTDAVAIFEDALFGMQSGRAGRFAVVVGVDRMGAPKALWDNGADIVVDDMADRLEI